MRTSVRRFLLAAIAACAVVPASAHASFVRDINWTSSSPTAGVQLLSGTFTDPAAHPSWTAALPAVGGVPTGLGVYDGKLESLSNGTRADLVLNGRRTPEVENLRATAQLHAGRSTGGILGINRQPESAEDCGVPDFSPTSS
ncbi:MAG TPA: hypothetical protein VGH30_13330, partial [Jatrophihabitantaceae bacterium]